MNPDSPHLNLESNPASSQSTTEKLAGTRKSNSSPDSKTESPKEKVPYGNTAKLGCSRAARDQIEAMVAKLVGVGIRVDAAELVNELVDILGQAGAYLLYSRKVGSLLTASVMIEERIDGRTVASKLDLTVSRRHQKNPFNVGFKPLTEAKE